MHFYSNYCIRRQPNGKYTLICFTKPGVLSYYCEDIDSYETAEKIRLDYLFKPRNKSKSSSLSSLLVNSKAPKFLYDGPYDSDSESDSDNNDKGNKNIFPKEEADKMESTIAEINSDDSAQLRPDSQEAEATLCLDPKWFTIDNPLLFESKDATLKVQNSEKQGNSIHEIHALDQLKAIDDKLKEIADKLDILFDYELATKPDPNFLDNNKIDIDKDNEEKSKEKSLGKRKPGRPKKAKKDESAKEEE